MKQNITILCGHYGCGKTNLSLNLALQMARQKKSVTLLDMDIVNPYFRSSEYGALLSAENIRLITPVFAGTALDTPVLPPEMYSIFTEKNAEGEVFVDAGGDDAGITALGGLSGQLREAGYEMLYVINRNRVLSQTPEQAVALLREIEAASHLRATAMINNTHLGVETTVETVLDSIPFARETANLSGLPLLYTTIPDFAVADRQALPGDVRTIHRYVKFPWESENEK